MVGKVLFLVFKFLLKFLFSSKLFLLCQFYFTFFIYFDLSINLISFKLVTKNANKTSSKLLTKNTTKSSWFYMSTLIYLTKCIYVGIDKFIEKIIILPFSSSFFLKSLSSHFSFVLSLHVNLEKNKIEFVKIFKHQN